MNPGPIDRLCRCQTVLSDRSRLACCLISELYKANQSVASSLPSSAVFAEDGNNLPSQCIVGQFEFVVL